MFVPRTSSKVVRPVAKPPDTALHFERGLHAARRHEVPVKCAKEHLKRHADAAWLGEQAGRLTRRPEHAFRLSGTEPQ